MFGIGSTELLVILVVALIVLGPKSLAAVSRSLGKVMGEFRRVSTDFQRSLNVEAAREEMREAEVKRAAAPSPAPDASQGTQTAPPAGQAGAEIPGPPPDSPLGQAIAKAQAQAAQAEKRPAGAAENQAAVQTAQAERAHG